MLAALAGAVASCSITFQRLGNYSPEPTIEQLAKYLMTSLSSHHHDLPNPDDGEHYPSLLRDVPARQHIRKRQAEAVQPA